MIDSKEEAENYDTAADDTLSTLSLLQECVRQDDIKNRRETPANIVECNRDISQTQIIAGYHHGEENRQWNDILDRVPIERLRFGKIEWKHLWKLLA